MKSMLSSVKVFSSTPCELGESPVWCVRRQGLFWLDISKCQLFFRRMIDEVEQAWALPCMCSAVILLHDRINELLLVSELGLAKFELGSGSFTVIAATGDESPEMRTNDAGVDPCGRIWFGTMQKSPEVKLGALYSIESDLTIKKRVPCLGIPNTMLWSEDGQWMIYADSLVKKIYRSRFNFETGDIAETEVIVELRSEEVDPDGSALDSRGFFWNAQWGGARVVAYDFQGKKVDQLSLPVLQPSSCAFGGEDMSFLFITSARFGLTQEQLTQFPLSGHVFFIQLDRKGVSLSNCKLSL